jgi:leader peptidase (prepilin peptidase)/N-methyltransferase
VQQLLGIALGAIVGLVADRVAARWPAHSGGAIRPIDWRTGVLPVAGAASFGALAGRWSEPRDLLVLGVYVAALMLLLATDLDQTLLPDVLTLPLAGYAAVLFVLGWNPLLGGKDLALVSAIAAGIGAPILLLVTDRLFGGALGRGDVKLAVGLGLMSGVARLIAGLLVASIAGAVVLLVLIAMRRISLRSAIPFGPILIGAGMIAALL